MKPYTILPLADPVGTCRPCWVMQDNKASALVQALPPHPQPLRFCQFDAATAWVDRGGSETEAG